jgi:hypothetical protein
MVSWPDFQDWRAAQTSCVGLGACSAATMTVSGDARPAERYSGAYFSANGWHRCNSPAKIHSAAASG